jgi:hypothetical protein
MKVHTTHSVVRPLPPFALNLILKWGPLYASDAQRIEHRQKGDKDNSHYYLCRLSGVRFLVQSLAHNRPHFKIRFRAN